MNKIDPTLLEWISNYRALQVKLDEESRGLEEETAALVSVREQTQTAYPEKPGLMSLLNHRIRTPLYGVTGMSELLAKTALDETQKTYLHQLQLNAEMLSAVLLNLLDYLLLRAGMLPLSVAPSNLKAIVESAVGLLSARAQAKGLELELSLDPALPARLWVDGQRFAQIIRHLVDNAIKFTHQGSVQVRVDALPGPERMVTCRVAVQDTGIGIPNGCQSIIFAEFAQMDASLIDPNSGIGLGLTICQGVIEQMGGRLVVTSQDGVGSTFSIEVPLAVADLTAAD